jgi:outer membrane protease
MEDYDWGDYTITEWTNWSESLIFMDKSFFLNVSSGYKYTLNDHFAIPIKFGYKLNYLDWEDQSGEYIYYWDFYNDQYFSDPPRTGDFGGVNGIDYKVIQNIFYASSGFLFTAGNISTGLNIYLSPLIYAWDLDHHILRNEAPYFFLDTFLANFWYQSELTINIKTRKNEEFMFTLFLEELPESVGDTYYFDKDPSDSEEVGDQVGFYQNGAGMASIMWGMSLSYIWSF